MSGIYVVGPSGGGGVVPGTVRALLAADKTFYVRTDIRSGEILYSSRWWNVYLLD